MSSHLSTFSESPTAAPALIISLISAATVFAEPPKVNIDIPKVTIDDQDIRGSNKISMMTTWGDGWMVLLKSKEPIRSPWIHPTSELEHKHSRRSRNGLWREEWGIFSLWSIATGVSGSRWRREVRIAKPTPCIRERSGGRLSQKKV